MITTILLNIFSYIMGIIVMILPTFTVWPQVLIDGLQYMCTSVAKLNFILPIKEWFDIILFFINFSVTYLTAKLILKAFNFLRGTGSGLDI